MFILVIEHKNLYQSETLLLSPSPFPKIYPNMYLVLYLDLWMKRHWLIILVMKHMNLNHGCIK